MSDPFNSLGSCLLLNYTFYRISGWAQVSDATAWLLSFKAVMGILPFSFKWPKQTLFIDYNTLLVCLGAALECPRTGFRRWNTSLSIADKLSWHVAQEPLLPPVLSENIEFALWDSPISKPNLDPAKGHWGPIPMPSPSTYWQRSR